MHFDWNHVFVDADMPLIDWPELCGQYSYAIRERLRIVLRDTRADDLWVSKPATPNAGAAFTPFSVTQRGLAGMPNETMTRDLLCPGEFGSNTLEATNYAAYQDEGSYTCPSGFRFGGFYNPTTWDGHSFEPAILRHGVWNSFHANRPNGTQGGGSRVPFSFPLAQRLAVVIAHYCVAPDVDYNGFQFATRRAAAEPYFTRYFPDLTDTGSSTNWRRENLRYGGLVPGSGSSQLYYDTPPTLAYQMPNWPGPNGFTRKRWREITSLSCAGNEGERAMFVVADSHRFGPAVEYTGIASSGYGYLETIGFCPPQNYPYVTPSAHPDAAWVVDPKSMTVDYQKPPLPETPEDERQYSLKVMRYVGGQWEEDDTPGAKPDVITLRGWMQCGDLVGPWLLNELRDAINQLGVTSWVGKRLGNPNLTPSGDPFVGLVDFAGAAENQANGGSQQNNQGRGYFDNRESNVGVGHMRHFGCNQPPFGPRSVKFYHAKQLTGTTSTPYGPTNRYEPWAFLGSVGPTTDRSPKIAATDVYTGSSEYHAIVDWRPAFAYRSDTNPASPPAWPTMPPSYIPPP